MCLRFHEACGRDARGPRLFSEQCLFAVHGYCFARGLVISGKTSIGQKSALFMARMPAPLMVPSGGSRVGGR
jgi:hypothetical protein